MINVVVTVRDRPRLTLQCLTTLVKTASVEYSVVVVDDGSQPETREMLRLFTKRKNVEVLRLENSNHVLGSLKNLGVWWSAKRWGRGEWLYLSDNDACFLPEWDRALTDVLLKVSSLALVGGQNHPYHQALGVLHKYGDGTEVREYHSLAGTSWMMSWEVWDKFGPLNDNGQPGICQSEDHAFCQRAIAANGKVGAIHPPVVIDCSLTGSDGKPALGAELKPQVVGVMYE